MGYVNVHSLPESTREPGRLHDYGGITWLGLSFERSLRWRVEANWEEQAVLRRRLLTLSCNGAGRKWRGFGLSGILGVHTLERYLESRNRSDGSYVGLLEEKSEGFQASLNFYGSRKLRDGDATNCKEGEKEKKQRWSWTLALRTWHQLNSNKHLLYHFSCHSFSQLNL